MSLMVLVLGLFSVTLIAGPTVIQDNRITNLATTPVLGRGYSIATNTYQSTCLKDVVMTEPSYDFTYSFKEMDEFLNESSSETNTLTKLATTSFRNYIVKKEIESQKKKGTEATTKTKQVTKKRIMATIVLDSYYASVDESKSPLSNTAAQLLNNNDIPGFFSSCGSYYVRSIGRNAVFVAVFEFESVSESEDKDFVYQLETEIKSFRKKVVTEVKTKYRGYWFWRSKASTTRKSTTTWEEDAAQTENYGEQEDTFSKSTEKRKLTITASAFGLGKNKNASLISYDIATFKSAIRDAFLSMQNPKTGKVTRIEVVPWVENTDFQALVKLDGRPEDVVKEELAGKETKKQVKRKLLLYEKKKIMNENAEFLAEIDRADRNMLNIYYKARLCRQKINNKFKYKKKGKLIYKADYASRYVRNNRYEKAGIKLTELDTNLNAGKIKGLLQAHREFMYGGGKWGAGAAVCMDQIMKQGIFRVSFRDISSCMELQEKLAQAEDELVENHCMPILFGKGIVPMDSAAATEEK